MCWGICWIDTRDRISTVTKFEGRITDGLLALGMFKFGAIFDSASRGLEHSCFV
jgi:hypothetical protein